MITSIIQRRPALPSDENLPANPVAIIEKKRDGHPLTREEIRYFVNGYASGNIPDYQAAAWCMAVFLNGMSKRETTELTMAMAESGEMLDLSPILGFVLDKHSSGGVGDKTSLVVLPLVVACGVPVAKMSGRGLSFSGGTLDKMESIENFNVNLSKADIIDKVSKHRIVLCGQTADLAPADAKFYALRDVTGTVSSKALIASSIMCKKIAAGAQGIVLDVKCGQGAFMPTVEEAKDLAQIMIDIGVGADRKVTALISDMNQPLGNAVGNALEVKEAIDTLNGDGPADFIEHCVTVAGHMLRLAGKGNDKSLADIRPTVEEKLASGEAFEVFKTLVQSQGGNLKQIDNPNLLPIAPVIKVFEAQQSGYLAAVEARAIGLAALELGAGRHKKGDPIDHSVGILIHHKVGSHIQKGDPLFTIHARTETEAHNAGQVVMSAHQWTDRIGLPVFYDVMFSD